MREKLFGVVLFSGQGPSNLQSQPLVFEVGRSRMYMLYVSYIVRKILVKEHPSGCSCSVLQIEPQQENHLSSKLGRNLGGGNILRKNL